MQIDFENKCCISLIHPMPIMKVKFVLILQETPKNDIIATNSDEVKMTSSNSSNDPKKVSTPSKLSITPTSTNTKIESRVKTVLARDKATGKKV